MGQYISAKYRDFDTSTLHNSRTSYVSEPGIYSGFYVIPNAGSSNYLDIVRGPDTSRGSVLLTNDGSLVRETTDLVAAVSISTPHQVHARYDLIVCEYVYSTDVLSVATYKVIPGGAASSPIKPVAGANQIPIAYVYVRAQQTVSGVRAKIRAIDIFPVGKASLLRGAAQVLDLYPEIAPANTELLYVYPGNYPDSSGSGFISFAGGYSTALSPVGGEGAVRYHLFGVSTSGAVTSLVTSTTANIDIPATEAYPVAVVKSRVISGKVRLEEVTHIKTIFGRTNISVDEQESYISFLSGSVFKYLIVETFNSLDRVNLNTVVGGTVALDSNTTSLAVTSSGSEVSFATTDLLINTEIDRADAVTIQARTNFNNLQFSYSVTSPTSGFTAQRFDLGDVIRINAQLATHLYLKFYVPSSAFISGSPKIFSYGALVNIDDEAQNAFNITEFGLDSVINSVNNLVANGDFFYWSKISSGGQQADLSSQQTLSFPITEDSPVCADGWQFTSQPTPFNGGVVQRINPSTAASSSQTALRVALDGSANTLNKVTVLEYRISRTAAMAGKHLSLALNYTATTPGSIRAGIAFFAKTPVGLVQTAKKEVTGVQYAGTLSVITDSTVGDDTYMISFYISFVDVGASTTYTIDQVRAAMGRFVNLPYLYVESPKTHLLKYHETGRVVSWGSSMGDTPIMASAQFSLPKDTLLGELIAQEMPSARSNRSTNLGDFTYTANDTGIVVSAASVVSGSITLDIDWEVFVKYQGTIT